MLLSFETISRVSTHCFSDSFSLRWLEDRWRNGKGWKLRTKLCLIHAKANLPTQPGPEHSLYWPQATALKWTWQTLPPHTRCHQPAKNQNNDCPLFAHQPCFFGFNWGTFYFPFIDDCLGRAHGDLNLALVHNYFPNVTFLRTACRTQRRVCRTVAAVCLFVCHFKDK